jgi:hypothetical protein
VRVIRGGIDSKSVAGKGFGNKSLLNKKMLRTPINRRTLFLKT